MPAPASKGLTVVLGLLAGTGWAGERNVGTYSSLAYNQESGDLHGLELALVPTDRGLVASVQIAQDGINELHLAPVSETAGLLTFSLRLDDGAQVDVQMRCSPQRCSGRYVWGRANVEFVLPRSHGYWNRR